MRLSDLLPEWLRVARDGDDLDDPRCWGRTNGSFFTVDAISQADGIWFLCPKCFAANGRSGVGVHRIICWRPRVPQTISPAPGRWEFQGSGFEDLELVAGSSSVLLMSGCQAHFYVRGGAIVDCS